jgi:hypothetical protein
LKGEVSIGDDLRDRTVELSCEFASVPHQLKVGIIEHHLPNLWPDLLIHPI